MHKIPFFIGCFLSCFIPGIQNRRNVRGWINVLFFYFPIKRFVKRVYNEPIKKIRFVRQISMKRMTCVVNDKYFVKIFRFVSVKRLNDYKNLLDAIRPYLNVNIPEIFVDKHIPMYVDERLPGTIMTYLNKKDVIKHERKITTQVHKMVDDLSGIPHKNIPNKELFVVKLQAKKIPNNVKITKKFGLAHDDLNPGNLLLDKDFNLVGVIDWDSLVFIPDANNNKNLFDKKFLHYKQQ